MIPFSVKRICEKYYKLWHDLSGWKLFAFYTVHYTLLFILLQHFIFAAFYTSNKSFMYSVDGVSEWCTYMVYFSQTIRNGIQSLLAGIGWVIPLYDFSLGPVQLDLRLEPIQLISVLWPWDSIDVLYDILVIVRYYLVGLSFSIFGFYFKQKPLPIMIGAVSYTFCGFTLYAGIRHPFYMAAVIYLPLLIVGIEKIFHGKNPFLLITIVFLAMFSNIYFAFMLAIISLVYVIICLFDLYKHNSLHEFMGIIARLIFSVAIGIALSGILMVPSLFQNISTGRVGRDISAYVNLLLYSKSVYESFISNYIIIPKQTARWAFSGFSVLALPTTIMLFVNSKKQEKKLRVFFVVLTIMLLLPIVGYIMSGFDSISNRWCFAYAFCVSAIIMFKVSQISSMNKRSSLFTYLGILVYLFVCSFVIESNFCDERIIFYLLITSLILYICDMLEKEGTFIILPACLIMVCLSVSYSAFLLYDKDNGNYISEFTSKNVFYERYSQSQYGSFAIANIGTSDNTFYRVIGNSIPITSSNMSFYYGINGLTGHSTYYYDSYWNWHQEMELPQKSMFGVYLDLDSRAAMLSLSGVKYYVLRENGNEIRPYGFKAITDVANGKNKDVIMINDNWLPLGYTYENYLTCEKYDTLTTLGKQEALLQAVVLDKTPDLADITEQDTISTSKKISYEITDKNNLTWENGVLKVNDKNASITLKFNGIPETETYLRIVNLDLNSGASTRRWTLQADTGETIQYARFCTDAYIYTHGMKTQMLNMGYSEEGYNTITITFPDKGTFILDDLEIWCQPMDNFAKQIEALRTESLDNVETNWRGLTGSISVSKDKILCIAIPYSDGWTAYVDGQKTELLQANTAFMGIELTKGEHNIELRYWLPGLTPGIILSLFGVFGLVYEIIYWRKKMKN